MNVGPFSYIMDAFFDCGPTRVDGMGESPVDWQTVWAWGLSSQILSEHWERKALIDMSHAYVMGRASGKEATAMSPWEIHLIKLEEAKAGGDVQAVPGIIE